MSNSTITVVGAGIFGLWQAYTLAKAGYRIRLIEESDAPFAQASSRWAGAMIAPECEAEGAPPIVRDLGREALKIWRDMYPATIDNGTLVVAHARDAGDLARFQNMTEGHDLVGAARIGELESALAGRFERGLYFEAESHLDARKALGWLLSQVQALGGEVHLGAPWDGDADGVVVDCRGIGAQRDLKALRGVRGERVLIATPDVSLARPVRLLHPRQPIYIVPQGDGRFVVGASVVEREDDGPMTLKSALDLLGSAYALHPAFGEASVLEMGAGIRPSFPDNVPRIVVEDGGKVIRVNGAYRHGFLLAPALAREVLAYLSDGRREGLLFSAP
ncbi:FAD-dependent oxidoreductase [Hyphomicrobium sp. MC1]|uniref:FAD-dependent oxidoreductase n=1 Tax=Hyphomicrobium sp. (strain MC1) TaxID=717785 RepID=UPI000213E3AA|nr:FAD-dependent oxidoreductase [Hyphomicrobium sp. MC1]CCB63963.1 putative thiamine biosynthesis oxidoreductase thiO [Hyphomicrobium sp. MC1]